MNDLVLAIETSCDDTSIAILNQEGYVLDQHSLGQELAHKNFGGVVPEIAGRKHTENILPLIETILKKNNLNFDNIESIAVTSRPGLIGALIVGVVTAKSLALIKNKKLIGVNHLEGHILAPFLKDESYTPAWSYDKPFLSLAVSGGHTHLYFVKKPGDYELLGKSRDDAAGEAFDKFAKLLGLGYPGGVLIDRLAKKGNPKAVNFPRPLMNADNYEFSFSGLKASGLREWNKLEDRSQKNVEDICASYQEAIVDVLVKKVIYASEKKQCQRISITGGVSANSRLRQRIEEEAAHRGWVLTMPPIRYCTDNAAMIGLAGLLRLKGGEVSDQSLGPSVDGSL